MDAAAGRSRPSAAPAASDPAPTPPARGVVRAARRVARRRASSSRAATRARTRPVGRVRSRSRERGHQRGHGRRFRRTRADLGRAAARRSRRAARLCSRRRRPRRPPVTLPPVPSGARVPHAAPSPRAEPRGARDPRPTPTPFPETSGQVSAVAEPDAACAGRRAERRSPRSARGVRLGAAHEGRDPRGPDRRRRSSRAAGARRGRSSRPTGAPIPITADIVLARPQARRPTGRTPSAQLVSHRRRHGLQDPRAARAARRPLVRHRPGLDQRRAVRDADGHRGRSHARARRSRPASGSTSVTPKCVCSGATDDRSSRRRTPPGCRSHPVGRRGAGAATGARGSTADRRAHGCSTLIARRERPTSSTTIRAPRVAVARRRWRADSAPARVSAHHAPAAGAAPAAGRLRRPDAAAGAVYSARSAGRRSSSPRAAAPARAARAGAGRRRRGRGRAAAQSASDGADRGGRGIRGRAGGGGIAPSPSSLACDVRARLTTPSFTAYH